MPLFILGVFKVNLSSGECVDFQSTENKQAVSELQGEKNADFSNIDQKACCSSSQEFDSDRVRWSLVST